MKQFTNFKNGPIYSKFIYVTILIKKLRIFK